MIEKIFDKKICYLVYFLPMFLVTGPAIPDIIISILSILFIIYCVFHKEFKLFNNKFFKIYLIFWVIINISSLQSDFIFISLKSSFFHIRFLIFGFFLYYLIIKNNNFFENFFPILTLTLAVVIFDGYYQYFFDKNILGFDRPYSNQRLSGFFNDEWILGSYLVRIFPLFLCVYILNTKKNNLLIFLFIFFHSLLIFLTGERASFFLLVILFFIFFIFLDLNKVYKFFILFLLFLIPVLVININENMKERMFNQVFISLGIFEDIPGTSTKPRQVKCCKIPKYLFSLGHSKHYEVAFKMFLDKPIFGHGSKSFRYKCHKFQEDIGCSSHPHNTYVQLLAETGIFSFILVLILFFLFCYLIIKNYLNRLKFNKNFYNARVFILSSFLISLFPIVPTGSFFTNWLSMMYFLPLGILFYLYDKSSYEKK